MQIPKSFTYDNSQNIHVWLLRRCSYEKPLERESTNFSSGRYSRFCIEKTDIPITPSTSQPKSTPQLDKGDQSKPIPQRNIRTLTYGNLQNT